MSDAVLKDARALAARIAQWRRYFHAHPELSGQERATAGFLAAELRRMGYEPTERVGGTFGLTATLPVNDRPAVALRADMDALPIQEETGLAFASQNDGVMHACGHDAHMAMLLGAAVLLKRRQSELDRPVKLIFQAEEERPPGGAAAMIRAGVLEHVESIFGLHVWSPLPLGVLGTRCGVFMSGVSDFQILIRGKGGHAAMPHECVDPIVVAAQVVLALQTVVSRAIALTDSAVVSVTRIEAGTAMNIIPESAKLCGTIRALDEAVHDRVRGRLRDLADGVSRAHDAAAEVDVYPGYPVLVNHGETVERVLEAARELGWKASQLVTLDPQGGGEDFAHYAQQVPAAFVFLGAGNTEAGRSFPHHHPRFTIDEDVLPMGTALLTQYALQSRPR